MQDKNKKFLFVRIPKTAGTTLRSAILEEDFQKNKKRITMRQTFRRPARSFGGKNIKNKNKYLFLVGVPEGASMNPAHATYKEWKGINPESQ